MTFKKKRNRRILTSMCVTLLAAVLFGGIAIADRNIRRIGFGDDRPIVGVSSHAGRKTVDFCLFGQAYSFDVTQMANLVMQAEDSIAHLLGNG